LAKAAARDAVVASFARAAEAPQELQQLQQQQELQQEQQQQGGAQAAAWESMSPQELMSAYVQKLRDIEECNEKGFQPVWQVRKQSVA
jgi:hypothetical protein